MRGWIAAALVTVAIAAMPSHAQTAQPAPAATPESLGQRFFEALKSGTPASAIDVIANTSPLLAGQIGPSSDVRSKIDIMITGYGPVVSWERVSSETLGTLLRRDIYLVQHRDAVLRWRLYFARLPRGWVFQQFDFNDQAPGWFD